MNKLVDWGHFGVASLFAIGAVLDLNLRLIRVLHGRHILTGLYRGAGASAYFLPIGTILLFLCAWGIMNWRTWAHTLAIVVCTLNLLLLFLVPRTVTGWISLLAYFFPFASILVWLLLPSVRAKFAKVV